MSRTKLRDALLLCLVAAGLLFGGGIGCDPELDGVDFRPSYVYEIPGDKNSPKDWYMRFGGKTEPGNAWAVLEYPMLPPYSATARFGVFDPDALAASEDAEGCIGFREHDFTDEFRLCVSYQIPTNVHIYSYNLDGNTADCIGASKAEIQLEETGANVIARYRCPGEMNFTQLSSVASRYNAGERWFNLTGAYNLRKGGEVGFDDFRVFSAGPFAMTPEAETAWYTFQGWGSALEAFYWLEAGDQLDAQDAATDAFGLFENAFVNFDDDLVNFSSDAEKLWFKGAKGFLKSGDALFSEKPDKYFKGAPKFLDAFACSLFEMEPDF